jgi:uncharacterized membrane protein YgdD (TMEM256/DUF423 family)
VRTFAVLGAINGLVAVAAGAFGAHELRARLAPERLDNWELAAHYQIVHALALLAVAWLAERGGRTALASGWCLVAGIAIFCGTLYLLAVTGARWLGAITPLGGLALLAGWALLAVTAWRLP